MSHAHKKGFFSFLVVSWTGRTLFTCRYGSSVLPVLCQLPLLGSSYEYICSLLQRIVTRARFWGSDYCHGPTETLLKNSEVASSLCWFLTQTSPRSPFPCAEQETHGVSVNSAKSWSHSAAQPTPAPLIFSWLGIGHKRLILLLC